MLDPTTQAHIASLVQGALAAADDQSVPTSVVARMALRVARLRNDWATVLWLQTELRPPGAKEAKERAVREVAPHFSQQELEAAWSAATDSYIELRTIAEDRVLGQALGEAEAHLVTLREHVTALREEDNPTLREPVPEGLGAISEREQILARVRQRVADYLSECETQLFAGHVQSDLFERNRRWVDGQLAREAAQAHEQLAAAYRRRDEGDPEARSHALTSCRRVLKSLADLLYPASGEIVTGVDGRERAMADDKFVMRLCQFATEHMAATSASRELVVAQIRSLGERLDALNDLSSKGVHAQVTPSEVDQCLIQTYLVAGDLLRLRDRASAAGAV